MALDDIIPGAWPGTTAAAPMRNPVATAMMMQRRNMLAAAAANPVVQGAVGVAGGVGGRNLGALGAQLRAAALRQTAAQPLAAPAVLTPAVTTPVATTQVVDRRLRGLGAGFR